jgi:hypothetical protein
MSVSLKDPPKVHQRTEVYLTIPKKDTEGTNIPLTINLPEHRKKDVLLL